LRRSGRRRGRKTWPRGRGRNHKFRRSGRRRSGRLPNGSRRGVRGGRDGGPGLDGRRNRRRSSRGCGPLLLADDGP
jgi:hypothetical protein